MNYLVVLLEVHYPELANLDLAISLDLFYH